MIGAAYFQCVRILFSMMLGLVWMLLDSVYNIVLKPKERSEEEAVPDEDKDDLTCAVDDKSNCERKRLEPLQEKTKFDKNTIRKNVVVKASGINLDVNYLSKGRLASTAKVSQTVGKKSLLKRPYEKICVSSSENVPQISEKSSSLTVIKSSFHKKSKFKNNLMISIKEINKFINRAILEETGENSIIFTKYSSGGRESDFNSALDLQNITVNLESKGKCLPVYPLIEYCTATSTSNGGKRIKLDNDQILALQETAQYIVKHLDIEVKTRLKNEIDDSEILNYLEIGDCNPILRLKQTKKNTESADLHGKHRNQRVIITELDSTEEIDGPRKIPPKNHRKKRNKKKQRYNKVLTQKVESSKAIFSSRQCFERLAMFMSTNQGFTQSKLMMEIEKEFRPIKDQISELRDSMTDFSVVNCRNNNKGVKSSTLSVQPFARSCFKSKSIFTIPSDSIQSLARLATDSVYYEEHSEIDSGPKKLSPMAEMYIKLSRQ